jgi:hypothetical protein
MKSAGLDPTVLAAGETLPSPVRPAFDTPSTEDGVIVNIGPSHPATYSQGRTH